MEHCEHESAERFRVCRHLRGTEDNDYIERFMGCGVESELVCRPCLDGASELVDVCRACRDAAAENMWDGIAGTPGIIDEPSTLAFQHRRVSLATPMLVDPNRVATPPKTPPIGRLITPEEVAELTAFLLGPHAGAITGQQIVICGGSSL